MTAWPATVMTARVWSWLFIHQRHENSALIYKAVVFIRRCAESRATAINVAQDEQREDKCCWAKFDDGPTVQSLLGKHSKKNWANQAQAPQGVFLETLVKLCCNMVLWNRLNSARNYSHRILSMHAMSPDTNYPPKLGVYPDRRSSPQITAYLVTPYFLAAGQNPVV